MQTHVLKLPIWDRSFFHIFLTIKSLNEVETEPVLSVLAGKDKHIVLSKTNFERENDVTCITARQYGYRIEQIGTSQNPKNGIAISDQQIEVVFIPLSGF